MATWYKTGTIDVTNGSATVTGTGTAFSANVQIGDALHAPDGNIYEITGVVSDTSLTIAPNYLGSTAVTQTYTAQPTRGWTKRVLDELDASNTDVTTMLAGPGAGKFPDGTLAQPGMRFSVDEDTGLRRPGSNAVALVAGGADKLSVTGNVASGDAVQSNEKDSTAGRLLKVGAFGLGGDGTNTVISNLDDDTVRPGSYSYTPSTTGTKPSGATSYGFVIVSRQAVTGVLQILYNSNTGYFSRTSTSGTWTNWVEAVSFDAVGDLNISGGTLFVDASTNRVGVGTTAPDFRSHIVQSADEIVQQIYATSLTHSKGISNIVADRTADAAFDFMLMRSNKAATVDTEFRFSGAGNGTCDGSWTGGGADYAEYFEWADGNPLAEDRRGVSVVLVGDQIREAQAGETPIGVISGNPSVVGDAASFRWKGKYLRDDFGSTIMEEYDVISWIETLTETDDEGEIATRDLPHGYAADALPAGITVPADASRVTQTRRKLNPDYVEGTDYTPREDRPEWDTVGLMGKLRLRTGQVTGVGWVKMRDVSADVEEWLVR